MNPGFSAIRLKSRRPHYRSSWFRLLLVAFLLLTIFTKGWAPALAAVTLSSFETEPGDGIVRILWTTATETNSSGFYVLRSTEQYANFVRISAFIPSVGEQLAGEDYGHEDFDVINGTTYYYRLEAIDANNRSEIHPPMSEPPKSALPGVATPTPTLTPTVDPNASPTFTNTPGPSPTASITPSPTLTQAATRVPTSTPVPSATITIEATGTSTPSATPTASATLIPLPEVTFTYPAPSATTRPTSTPLPLETEQSSDEDGTGGQSDALRIGLLASIVLLWILLGGWLYIFLYRSGI
jgi:hypothetical protein